MSFKPCYCGGLAGQATEPHRKRFQGVVSMAIDDRRLARANAADIRVSEHLLNTTVAAEYAVIVAGGGAAGLVTAVAAARHGAKTLLVERQGCLGGTATTGYVAQYIGIFNQGIQ